MKSDDGLFWKSKDFEAEFFLKKITCWLIIKKKTAQPLGTPVLVRGPSEKRFYCTSPYILMQILLPSNFGPKTYPLVSEYLGKNIAGKTA